MNVEVLADYECKCGENPLWHPTEKRFYWTDIPTGRLFWYDPATGEHQQCYEGRQVGGFTFQADGSLLLFMDKGTVAEWRDGEFTRTIINQIPDEVRTRFNDVMADPEGRVFCGTMPVPGDDGRPGRLYRLDTDGSIHLLLEGIGCSNGMGFTPDGNEMYYTDTPPRAIWKFDYDQNTGAIINQREFVRTEGSKDGPDGMTVDEHGDVWCARWGGYGIIRFSPEGEEKERIDLPAKNITSCIFGGENYDELYITTAIAGDTDRSGRNEHAGKLLRINPGVKGKPECYSRISM